MADTVFSQSPAAMRVVPFLLENSFFRSSLSLETIDPVTSSSFFIQARPGKPCLLAILSSSLI